MTFTIITEQCATCLYEYYAADEVPCRMCEDYSNWKSPAKPKPIEEKPEDCNCD